MKRPDLLLTCLLLPAMLGGCALLPPRGAAAQKKAEPRLPREARQAEAQLSPEVMTAAERLYYKAVGAYSNNDMASALEYLEQISAIAPSYPPAAELREKIRRVSGGR